MTSPQRQDVLSQAAQRSGAAAEAYEAYKRAFLVTAADCTTQGFSVIPMVAEPSGGWGPSAMCTLKAMARAAAARSTSGAESSVILAERLQRLCAVIRRATARAVLRRDVRCDVSTLPAPASALALLATDQD